MDPIYHLPVRHFADYQVIRVTVGHGTCLEANGAKSARCCRPLRGLLQLPHLTTVNLLLCLTDKLSFIIGMHKQENTVSVS